MASRIPQLRQKANGAFFVRWGGKDRYLSTDAARAERLYVDPASTHQASLTNYRAWKAQRDSERDAAAQSTRAAAGQAEPRPVTLADMSARMLAWYDGQDRRGDPGGYFRRHLTRYLNVAGEIPLRDLARLDTRRSFLPPAIALARALADDMASLGLSPKTIQHDLTAIKRLFAWGVERGHVPELPWRTIRKPATRRGKPVVHSPAQIRAAIDAAMAHPDPAVARVAPWLAVNYLTGCRPSEVVTIVQMVCGWPTRHRMPERGPGRPDLGRVLPLLAPDGSVLDARGMVELLVHKNDWRDDSGQDEPITRLLILTPQARSWLALCRPAWGSLAGYSSAARAAGIDLRPSHCRDSAASHLRHAGADLADTALVLGHAHRGEWPSYAQVPWHALAQRVAGLSIGEP